MVDLLASLDHPEHGMTFLQADDEHFVSYASLRNQTQDTGRRLAGLGLQKGDRVVLILPSEAQFITAFLGAMWAGVVPVPLFPPFLLGELDLYLGQLDHVAAQCDPRLFVASPEVTTLLRSQGSAHNFVAFEEVQAAPPRGELPAVTPDDTAFIQYTSGSTGSPKGVVVPHRALMTNATIIADHLDVDCDADRGASWLPLYHDMGLIGFVIVPMLAQASTWYMPPLDFARNPSSWCRLIDRIRGTIAFAPNFAYNLVARRVTEEQVASWDLSCWRVAGCGAEPIRPQTLEAFAERLHPTGFRPEAFLPCYGLAEATLAVSLVDVDRPWHTLRVDGDALRREGRVVQSRDGDDETTTLEFISAGRTVPGHELLIVDAAGNPLGEDREGEIVLRGPCVTDGYFAEREATASSFRDGWLHTWDMGFVHDGELYVTGRVKDLLIINGRNHHPQDLEWCAGEEPGVRRGCVVAFARAGRGSEEAVVVLESSSADADELSRRVARRIRNQVGVTVAEVVVVAKGALPKTTSGKLRRQETRVQYLAGALPVLEAC